MSNRRARPGWRGSTLTSWWVRQGSGSGGTGNVGNMTDVLGLRRAGGALVLVAFRGDW
jgi:hypothetical protein